jgi:DNA-binding NarL/FixJ family response regulator
MTAKMVLADDHVLFRDGLRVLLEKEADLTVVGEANNGREAVRLVAELQPDIVVMDVSMPDLNGIEAACEISARTPKTKVLGLSMHSDRRFVARMLQAGAAGYLLKDCDYEEFLRAVRAVLAGQTYLSPAVAGEVVNAHVRGGDVAASPALRDLTSRQREILQLLAEGRTTKQIAAHLHVSVKTVNTHRQNIMDKLGLHNVAALTKFAIREGLTSLEP